ncbi:MAG: SsrA-binding protein SmpB [Cellvibrionaceae bacterium]
MAKKKKQDLSNTIAQNKKAKHDYHLSDKLEAGVSLLGWEVKSMRDGKVQLTDSYVIFQNGEALLVGVNIQPLKTVSTHYVIEPNRARKLLMKRKELAKLQQQADQKGYAILCTALYWKKHLVKAEIMLGKGKKDHDKRDVEKERDWNRQKERIMKHG